MADSHKIIYLDNAATSWPKPPEMMAAIIDFNQNMGANPGRSGHRLSAQSARVIFTARQQLADLFNAPDALRIIFGANITAAINLALMGLLKPGDHVVTSSMEHNSVMRPLRALEERGVEVSVVACSSQSELDPQDISCALKPNTRLIALNHASNVIGTLLPVKEVGKIAQRHGALLLVDCAQTAGAVPIDLQADHIDLLAFTGHKALYGPMGTGGLVLGERVDIDQLDPLVRGGTGSNSEHEQQPRFTPDKYESGTANAIGLAGLGGSLAWLSDQTVERVRKHEKKLTQELLNALNQLEGVQVFGTQDPERQTAVVSFTVDGMDNGQLGHLLDERYGILCRVGLHCAPAAHRTIGTFPQGSVRFGLGFFNTSEQISTAAAALQELISERKLG